MPEPELDPTLADLKAQLATQVAARETDYEAILRLAGEIGRLEPDVVRFSTDAAMVRRLGHELVAKQETALGELVKNAYDADALLCTVDLIEDVDPEDAARKIYSFEIIDDGNGMAREELVNGFMRLASDTKVRNPLSPRYGRSRAGKKGIGRFATERLGQRLTIVTQTCGAQDAWSVSIDWRAFGPGEDIGLVANRIARVPKERDQGTRLRIEGLKDSWSDADLRRVYRYLSTLLQPIFRGEETGRSEGDPGFRVQLNRANERLQPETVASADSEVLDRALAVIDARIDGDGRATWSLNCKQFKLEIHDVPVGLNRNRPEPLEHARDVRLKAWYFIRAREFLGHSTGYIGKILDEHGGVRLYRNGYRVPPYGEKNDDWLGLDAKNTQIYAPLNSKVFIGFVAVSDPVGERFEETSSREGLLETAAFAEVREIAASVLTSAVGRIESARGLGRKPRKRTESDSGSAAAKEAQDAFADVETLVGDAVGDGGSADPELQERLGVALERLRSATETTGEVARERDELVEELNMTRILASMGLSIAEFTHDFSALAETMELNLSMLGSADPGTDAHKTALERFRNQFRQVRAYTAHFGSMATENASRALQPIDLYDFSRRFVDDLAVMFDERGMDIQVVRPAEYDLRTTDMHPSEWSSILLNLLTNAIKAADRAQQQGRFQIRVGRSDIDAMVWLDFSDNGDGIPAENRGKVFDAFFTTSGAAPVRASEAARALGTGLGLKIVADLASAAGGEVTVLDEPADGYATTIRIKVPAAAPDGEPVS